MTEMMLRWIVLVPLLGAAINGLLNRRLPRPVAGLLACTAVGISFAMSVMVFLRLTGLPAEARYLSDTVATWLAFGNLQVDLGFAIDEDDIAPGRLTTPPQMVRAVENLPPAPRAPSSGSGRGLRALLPRATRRRARRPPPA